MANAKNEQEYLSLKDVAKILGKNEAALRARIKRGNLAAITRPLPSVKKDSKRFRYLIPVGSVKAELAEIVRKEPTLQLPLAEDEAPNMYQIVCDILSQQENGLTLDELRWHLERFHGLSLPGNALGDILSSYGEFNVTDGRYALSHPILYRMEAAKRPAASVEEPAVRPAMDAQSVVRSYDQRITALETKLDMLIQLLSAKIG